jgi:hypothetical protein
MAQLSFFPKEPDFHGGGLARKGRRKKARPLNEKRPLHLVLKAKYKIFYPLREKLYAEIREKAKHFGLTAYGLAVNLDHLHFILRIPSRRLYRAFIRAFAGVVARRYGAKLWKLLPFTRVMHWGDDFEQGLAYLKHNREEASGASPYKPRKDWYKKWRDATE